MSLRVDWRFPPVARDGAYLHPWGCFGRLSMGFVMDFDARNNILRVTLEGQVTDAILSDGCATASRYVASHPPCRGIWNLSEVTQFEVSSDTIRELAGSSPIILQGHMRVVVA